MKVPHLDKLAMGLFYADDVVIFCETIAKLERALLVLEEWSACWGLMFGVRKCGAMACLNR